MFLDADVRAWFAAVCGGTVEIPTLSAKRRRGAPTKAERVARQLISKVKNYAPIYDLLYIQYARQNKMPEAEQLLKLHKLATK